MGDNEIIRALECCYQRKCDRCERLNNEFCEECECRLDLMENALDLIKRQRAEKEALIAGQETLQKALAEKNAEIEDSLKLQSKRFKENCKIIRQNGVLRDKVIKLKAEIKRLEIAFENSQKTSNDGVKVKLRTNDLVKGIFCWDFTEKRIRVDFNYKAIDTDLCESCFNELVSAVRKFCRERGKDDEKKIEP